MQRRSLGGLLWLGLICVSAALAYSKEPGRGVHWPSFRGHNAAGIAEGYPTPLEWDVVSGKGILWKTPIPGLGHSSPAVWGDLIFVTTAVGGPAVSGWKKTGAPVFK